MTDAAQMREELLDIIAKEGLVDRAKLIPEATIETIGLASYDMVMILMAIEEKYNVYLPVDAEISDVKTLGALLDVLVARIEREKTNPTPRPADDAASSGEQKA